MFKTKQKFCQNNINKNVLNRNRKKENGENLMNIQQKFKKRKKEIVTALFK